MQPALLDCAISRMKHMKCTAGRWRFGDTSMRGRPNDEPRRVLLDVLGHHRHNAAGLPCLDGVGEDTGMSEKPKMKAPNWAGWLTLWLFSLYAAAALGAAWMWSMLVPLSLIGLIAITVLGWSFWQ